MARKRLESPPALLRRLRLTVLQPLASALGGDERSLYRGFGMELDELRPYAPGDDVRHIDWNITARAEEPYVRQARVERALDAWLLLDVSASVDWGTALCAKRDRADEFVAAVGQVLGQYGNRVGALLFAERPLGLHPLGTGRAHLLGLLGRLGATAPQATHGPTDLVGALERLGALARRRALIVIVSDFLVGPGWQRPLARLAARHDVVAVRLHDPREATLPPMGIVALEDPETGRQLVVDTSDAALCERFRVAAAAQAASIASDLRRVGVDLLTLGTDEELLPPLLRFLRARRHAGRRSNRVHAARNAQRAPQLQAGEQTP
jgi:uncharacterized protein (DUF58 family)